MIASLIALPNLSLAESNYSDTEAAREASEYNAEQKRETIKDEIEAKKEALEQEMEQNREEIKNRVEERRQNTTDQITERVNKFISKIIERFSTAANRLDILVIRIESRIEKIEARDIDVTEANDLLVIAKTKIETAKTSISLIALPEIIDPAASTTASAIKEAFETTKTQIEQAKKDLKAAHAALVEVIKSLKPGDNKLREIENDESEDDSTATTTDDN